MGLKKFLNYGEFSRGIMRDVNADNWLNHNFTEIKSTMRVYENISI